MKTKAPHADCQNCPLANNKFVPSNIVTESDIIIIGEAPSVSDTRKGIPFSGMNGILVNSTLKENGYTAPVSFTNAVACQVKGSNAPSDKAIECCQPRLAHEINELKKVQPELKICATGNIAAQALDVGQELNGLDRRGRWFSYNESNVIATLHPSSVLKKPDTMVHFSSDLRKLVEGRQTYLCQNEPEVSVINALDDLINVLNFMHTQPRIAVDIETDGLYWYEREGKQSNKIIQLGIAWAEDEGCIIPHEFVYGLDSYVYNVPDKWLAYIDRRDYYTTTQHYQELAEGQALIQQFFDEYKGEIVLHNGKFDQQFLRAAGIECRNDFDTLLAHYALCELKGTHSLKSIVADEFGIIYADTLVKQYLPNKEASYAHVPFKPLGIYCVWDCCFTWKLAEIFQERLTDEGLYEWPFKNLLMRLSNALMETEYYGIPVDVPYLKRWKLRVETHVDTLWNELIHTAQQILSQIPQKRKQQLITRINKRLQKPKSGYSKTVVQWLKGEIPFKPSSTYMLACLIYDVLRFPEHRAHKISARSTSVQALDDIFRRRPDLADHPYIKKLLAYRKGKKTLSTYFDNMLDHTDIYGFLHSSFHIFGTEIGRLSSSDSNVHNITRPYDSIYGAVLRSIICAKDGWCLVDADYSQAELRGAAALSNDSFLLNIYATGGDLHSEVAKQIYGPNFNKEQRTYCKNLNFSFLYGGNEYSFASQSKLPIEQAREVVRSHQRVLHELTQWKDDTFMLARKQGYVQSPFGRKRRFSLITHDNLDEVRKASVHALISGAASDLNCLAFCQLVEEGMRGVMLVHDSIIFHVPIVERKQAQQRVIDAMVQTGEKHIPNVAWKADCESSKRWWPLTVVDTEYDTGKRNQIIVQRETIPQQFYTKYLIPNDEPAIHIWSEL